MDLQFKIDAMGESGGDVDKYLDMLEKRATTAEQKKAATKYPIWRSLMNKKVKKLTKRALTVMHDRNIKATFAASWVDGVAVTYAMDRKTKNAYKVTASPSSSSRSASA